MASGPSFKQLAGYSICPQTESLQKTPTYVIITATGSYGFSYPDRSNGQTTSSYITGSLLNLDEDKHALPLKLDINPVKWTRLDGVQTPAKIGDVIFVYRRMH